jgi:hypothetical protein
MWGMTSAKQQRDKRSLFGRLRVLLGRATHGPKPQRWTPAASPVPVYTPHAHARSGFGKRSPAKPH